MKIMKVIPMNDYKTELQTYLSSTIFATGKPFEKITSIRTDLKAIFAGLSNAYCAMGLTYIGRWENTDDFTAIIPIIEYTFIKHYSEFLLYEKQKGQFLTNPVRKANHVGASDSTAKSAAEISPIDSATIESAPTPSAGDWDITNPNSKSGTRVDANNSYDDTRENPDDAEKSANFNILKQNLTTLCEKCFHTFIHEYNIVY